ncbi:hypothetical protein [Hephaestia mangrovi]|uniref:hypothetical protein n=1 Tax=Hephaestia mangrovi TaxID=2873268 RepID=UPI001CA61218|nr:hypothetical protein [Hephaestia mangrovi]MBY8826593.1 hypothetical protein [Hephaestia mangrovi]
MNKWMHIITLLLCAVGFSSTAHARCAEFDTSSGETSLRYNPFDPGGVFRIFTLRIKRLDPQATSVRILFADPDTTTGVAGIGPQDVGRFDLRWTQDAGREVLATGAEQPNPTNGVLIGFGPGRSGDLVTTTFRLYVQSGQSIPAGDYVQPLDVRFVCYAGGQTVLDGPDVQPGGRVALYLTVPQEILTYIGSPGLHHGDIDFGTLQSNQPIAPRSLIVTAQTTVPYDIDVDEDNHGLKKRGDSGGEDFVLPYRLSLSGLPVGDRQRVSCPRTPVPTGRHHRLDVSIEQSEVAKAPAGDYHDVVTLTFSPRLGLAGGTNCAVSMR